MSTLELNYNPEVLVVTENLPELEWLEYRRKGIGGSDVAAVMGQSPFCTTRDLYYDKRGIKPAIEEESNWVAKKYGHLLEDLVAEIFSKKMGLKVYPVRKMFYHPLFPFMLADVDFFIEFPDGKKGILECKTTNYNCQDKWANESVPLNYEYQGRHYMSVMNIDIVYYACLYGNNENEFIIRKIERDLDIENDIIEQEKYFWEEHVLSAIEPPYTEKPDLVLESIKKHYGLADVSKGVEKLDKSLIKEVVKILELKDEKAKIDKQSKQLEEEVKKLYTPIIEKLGTSCKGKLSDGKSVYDITYNPSYRTGINKDNLEKLKLTHKDIYDEYVTTTENRMFRVKKGVA